MGLQVPIAEEALRSAKKLLDVSISTWHPTLWDYCYSDWLKHSISGEANFEVQQLINTVLPYATSDDTVCTYTDETIYGEEVFYDEGEMVATSEDNYQESSNSDCRLRSWISTLSGR